AREDALALAPLDPGAVLGLAMLGAICPAFREARGWRERARRGLGAGLGRLLPDGGGRSGSHAEQRLVVECLALAAIVLGHAGLPLSPAERGALRRAFGL